MNKTIQAYVITALFILPACQDSRSPGEIDVVQPIRQIAWAKLPAGCFEMGQDGFYREEQPVTTRCVDEFEIMTTEVTNAQFAAFVKATGYRTQAERGSKAGDEGLGIDLPPGSMVFSPKPDARSLVDVWKFTPGAFWANPTGKRSIQFGGAEANVPVTQLTYGDARAYAEWVGARLPTEAEWEYAAKFADRNKPIKRDDPPISPKIANSWQGVFPVLDQGKDGYKGIAPVASFPVSPVGLYDMRGNVWEMTASAYYPNHDSERYETEYPTGFDRAQPNVPVSVIKGGSFLCSPSYCARYRPAARQAQDRFMATNHIGFRLVRDIK